MSSSGAAGGELAVEAQHLGGVVERVEDRPGEHDRPDRVQAVLERRDDAEVPAAAAHAPEQIRVVVLAGGDELAVRSDEVDGEQVVDRRAVLAHQPADPAAERQAGDAGVRDDAADRGEPEELCLAVELAPQHARLGARRPRCRVDADALHRRQVDHEPAVAERMPADPVATGAHRDEQIALARVANGRDHVGDAGAARDAGRPAVDRAVPDPATGVIVDARRQQQLAAQRAPQLVEPLGLARRCPAALMVVFRCSLPVSVVMSPR